MKTIIFVTLLVCFFALTSFADTTLSRDGEGLKFNGTAFGSVKSKSLGTKGFACFSTLTKLSWKVKVSATTLTDSVSIPFKYFINNDETNVYPVTDSFEQWQNAPVSKSPTISKACMRAYSSSVEKTAYGVLQ